PLPTSGSGCDLQRHHCRHAGEELHRDVVGAHFLDVVGEQDVLTVDFHTLGGADRLDHVGGTDRPEEPSAATGPGREGNDRPGQDRRLTFRGTPVLGLAQVAAFPHLRRLALHTWTGQDGPAFGQQEVPGEAAGDLDDVPAAPDTGDVV